MAEPFANRIRAEAAPLLNLMIAYADARVDRACGFGVTDEAVTNAMQAFTRQLARVADAAGREATP